MPSSNQSLARPWALLAVVVLALAGCTGTDKAATTAGPADIGGTMVIATAADAGTMLPVLIASNVDREVTDLLYDRLAELGTDMVTVGDKGFTPQLAQRWEWAPDSMSIVFHLNPAARWHDGRPVRASDVRFSLGLVKNPATGSAISSLVTNVDSISIRDSVTVVAWFKMRTPEQFYELVYQIPIMPEHLLANTPPGDLKASEVSRRGIGSGRFRLGRWAPGERIELLSDTANYRGRAKLDRVVFSIAPDAAASVARFFSGDADMHETLRPDNLAQLATDTVRRLLRLPNLQHAYMAFNLVDPTNGARPHPIFGDRAVRRALTMAVDRRAMLRNVFDTLGQLSYGPFPSRFPVADTTLPQIPYDTAAARALLDSAGWVMGPGGVRVKNGRRLEFGLMVPNSSAPRKAYSVLMQEAFRRVGASVRIEEMDFGSFSAKQAARTFDTEIAAYGSDPSASGLKQAWSTEGMKPGGFNFPSYSNPTVDALLDSATTTFDFARTRDFARRAFGIMIEDAPGIWLYEPLSLGGIDRRIRVTALRPDGYWSGMADWWIPAGERTARDRIGLRPTP